MRTIVRDVREQDLESVLALNNAAGAGILPIDTQRLRFFWEHAVYFRVAEREGGIAGFLIALGADADYESPNFLWFREQYPDFIYIDRIVIAGAHRGEGIGHVFYADVQSFAEVRSQRLTCEVFVTGHNDAALLFHGGFGFRQVGQQVQPGSGLRASYLVKDLCSFPWVRDTYLRDGAGGLPDVDWLHARHTCSTHATPSQAQH
ncbi:MAG: GNAT family N-acetyltransferase [Proteobacteria bacterium]|nr:GNAT family N-acetyltransferase [Pseudomonadota bacterium]